MITKFSFSSFFTGLEILPEFMSPIYVILNLKVTEVKCMLPNFGHMVYFRKLNIA